MSTIFDDAAVKQVALGDLEQELASTRRVLEAVPEEHFAWKPHPKSFSLQHLAAHLVNLLFWQLVTIRETGFDMAAGPANPDPPESTGELLARFDEHAAAVRTALDGMTADQLLASWTLRAGDQVIFTQPRGTVLRSFGLSHMAHHRGQLSVYLRLLDVPVPSVYGPTADAAPASPAA